MKRLLLFLFVFAYYSQVKASDTLTIRQIYNFDVGDTFDYYHFTAISNSSANICNDTIIRCYQRNIIISRVDALDSITYVISETFNNYPFSNPTMSLETVILTHLDSTLLDTAVLWYNSVNHHSFPFLNIGDRRQSQQFYTYQDIINWDTFGVFLYSKNTRSPISNYNESWYYNKLGMTYYSEYDVDGDGFPGNSFYQLVCYSKRNVHACGPNYLAGINDLANSANVRLYPNPASDQLHLLVTNAGQLNARFVITDMLGQELYCITVINDDNTLNISKLSKGIYSWKLVSENNILKVGKVIKD